MEEPEVLRLEDGGHMVNNQGAMVVFDTSLSEGERAPYQGEADLFAAGTLTLATSQDSQPQLGPLTQHPGNQECLLPAPCTPPPSHRRAVVPTLFP